jgi:uncharacterized protein (DUF488 family)
MAERMTGRLYSVGYEGMTLESLIERLTQNAVSCLIDVRLTPSSRRPGFSKRALASALAAVNIEYIHERELGNPPDNRDAFRSGTGLARGRHRMRSHLQNGAAAALDRVASRAQRARIALLCVEQEEPRCHRSVVIEEIVARAPGIDVVRML